MQHRHHHMLSVWFFIGVLLLIDGIIILSAGIADYHRPSSVVLGKYHAPLWGGALLIVLGTLYTWLNWPRKDET
jgi:energy-converting hydrogenase Eha subunit E